jgi:hypothetical protein
VLWWLVVVVVGLMSVVWHQHLSSSFLTFFSHFPLLFSPPSDTLTPPLAERIPHILQLHGHTLIDNYFWLRERNNPKVIQYLEAENKYFEGEEPEQSLSLISDLQSTHQRIFCVCMNL